MNFEMAWLSGHILELGADGFGYVVDDAEPARSFPFFVSRLEERHGPPSSLEGASVRYILCGHTLERVKLVPAFV